LIVDHPIIAGVGPIPQKAIAFRGVGVDVATHVLVLAVLLRSHAKQRKTSLARAAAPKKEWKAKKGRSRKLPLKMQRIFQRTSTLARNLKDKLA
jgi:cell division septation protein DedD